MIEEFFFRPFFVGSNLFSLLLSNLYLFSTYMFSIHYHQWVFFQMVGSFTMKHITTKTIATIATG
jgi:hypothetical protein